MSTNEEAAIASFRAIKGNRVVIVGGRGKGDPCIKYLSVLVKEAKACVIMGENADDIARYFESHDFHRYRIARDMLDAIRKCRELAAAGDVIMLNPGFASFGNFKDFQERGDAFKNGILQN
jgi:UDP-N-acetylmuramoylalanine--D-glutamate ligase